MLSKAQKRRLRNAPLNGSPNRLKAAMKAAGITQQEMADRVGLPQSSISKIAKGKTVSVDLAMSAKLAKEIGCEIELIFPVETQALAS